KLCTLNPARLLHLDSCMGSVAPGKDADLVIWTDNPLSVYAKVAMTFVDGICYFDRQKEKTMKNRMREERSRLILLMKRAAEKGEKTQAVPYERKREYRCDTLENLD
ncbi:MAG: amidohydrolase family protein, partial [Flavobacteriales bacterium]